jgi:hypothetical protein
MTSVSSRVLLFVVAMAAVACSSQAVPPPQGDDYPDPTPINAKEFLRLEAVRTAVGIFDVDPKSVTPCELEIPEPPAGGTVQGRWRPGQVGLMTNGDTWFPSQQPQLGLPFIVSVPSEDPQSTFYEITQYDLEAQDAELRALGFTGQPLALKCGEMRILKFQAGGERMTIDELSRDGTTLEEMKQILTETAKLEPILEPNRIVGFNNGAEPPDTCTTAPCDG